MNQSLTISRYALYIIIAALVFLLLQQWSDFSSRYEQKLLAEAQRQQPPVSVLNNDSFAEAINDDIPVTEAHSQKPSKTAGVESLLESSTNAAIPDSASRTITITTDTLNVTIDKLGGDIVGLAMLKHLESLEKNAQPLELLEKTPSRTYVAQSGLIGEGGSNNKSARAFFSSEKNHYESENNQTIIVPLYFKDPNGVILEKTFSIAPESYQITVSYNVSNNSDQTWQGTFYSKISRDSTEDPTLSSAGFGTRSYLGAATTTDDDPYKKIDFSDIEKKSFRNSHQGGWISMIQHYFVSAWIPNQQQEFHYYTKRSNNGMNIIGFYGNPIIIEPGNSATVSADFYAGPKDQYALAKLAKHLDLTVDYGWFWWLSQPLYAVLNLFATGELHFGGEVYKVFAGFQNWGVAIILLTVFIKLLFYKLSAASYRSMANMRRVQPKLLDLRERHANDKQAQSKAMMELYKKEKINPLGGCLPILIQMPVFIALYWALIESVQLRHAPFALWITDLSVMDPYFVLPVIMGATMFFQQKMNPAPPDPMQAKIMSMMPIVFTFFFLWFPAGLVVYWVSNNILSILQQWFITHNINKAHETS
jgi:YidC/Oxa1 family membrane protein insertase